MSEGPSAKDELSTKDELGISVCTLVEGDYHKGAAALINSLARAGFSGNAWVGFRGELPEWMKPAAVDGACYSLQLTDKLRVVFVRLETKRHFAHYKPDWCLEVLNRYDPAAAGVYYFDPDIVALAKWNFFVNWIDCGIAVCEDSHYPLNPTHPRALAWQGYAKAQGMAIHRPADANLNSGLVGVKREHSSFLEDWQRLLRCVSRDFGGDGVIKYGTRAEIFHIPDQDTFTVATWTTEHPVSLIGVDAMSFGYGEWLTLHATEGVKPWRRKILSDLWRKGIGPNRALRKYWEFADGPIHAEPAARVKAQRRLIRVAALLSRFYHRM